MFLRRKKSNINDTAVSQPAVRIQASAAPSAPLYERFATAARTAAPAPTSSRRASVAISRPMVLGVKQGNIDAVGATTRISPENGLAKASTSPPKSIPSSGRKSSTGHLRDRARAHDYLPPVPPTAKSRTHVTDEWSSGDEVSSDTERYSRQRQITRQAQQPLPPPIPLSPPTSPGTQKRLTKMTTREPKSGDVRLSTPPSPRSKPLPPPVPEPPVPRLAIPSSTSSDSESSYGAPTPTATSNISAMPSRLPLSSSSLSPKSTPATSTASPSVDETGFVSKSSSNEPALGNSLTSRAPPMRRKYSPLAAFGPSNDEPKPSLPKIVLSSSTSEVDSASDAKVDPSAAPLAPDKSHLNTLAGSPSRLGGSSPLNAELSGRHASIQPLKTASVELRVAFNPEEQKFHSPLFATSNGENGMGTTAAVSTRGIPSAIDHVNASGNKTKKERGSRDRKNVISTPTRHEMNSLNGTGLGHNARTLPSVHSSPLPSTSPTSLSPLDEHPSPSSASRGRQESPSEQIRPLERSHSASRMRQRTNSASSTSSTGKRREALGAQQLPDLPTERALPPQREIIYATGPSRQSSSESVSIKAKQIPTPPTSVDGHSIKSGKGTNAKVSQVNGSASNEGQSGRDQVDADQDLNSILASTTTDLDARASKKSSSKRRKDAEAFVGQRQKAESPTVAQSANREPTSEQSSSPVLLTKGSLTSPVQRNGDAMADNINDPPPPSLLHAQNSQTQTTTVPLVPSSRRARSGSSSRKNTEAGSSSGHTTRKLLRHSPATHMVSTQVVESPIDLETGEEMGKDADPFAKDDVLRTPVAPVVQSRSDSAPLSPSSPDDYFAARSKRRGERLEKRPKEVVEAVARAQEPNGHVLTDDGQQTPRPFDGPESKQESEPEPEAEPEPEREPTFYPLEGHLTTQPLLAGLLPYLTFRDWCIITEVNDTMRRTIEHRRDLRETVLEYFLGTVGYSRWKSPKKEPIMLTFRDLNSYMRGVSIPTHQYANAARVWLETRVTGDPDRSAAVQKTLLASSCRAYTRVVLRLRAQGEADTEDSVYQFSPPQSSVSVNSPNSRYPTSRSRSVSRPASPTSSVGYSAFSQSNHGHGHGRYPHSEHGRAASSNGQHSSRFRSPLFRVGHAPFLRVFVPNAEGEWLSDQSVVDCEKELKRAGVLPLLRAGDVVWDAAVGDEGNIGRMVWDGNYLIDLDYTFSRIGELPQYLHTLAFPPSYFHRVIRTNGNPICHIDIAPWGDEIAANLQLLQDRIQTETPQGGRHTVVRWIHRSRFRIRPNPFTNAPVPLPSTNMTIDPGWYGFIIVETEGTNEGLADLQDRCRGIGFPPRAGAPPNKNPSRVYRLLRERSRPGEIWIRTVREKERVL